MWSYSKQNEPNSAMFGQHGVKDLKGSERPGNTRWDAIKPFIDSPFVWREAVAVRFNGEDWKRKDWDVEKRVRAAQ